MSSGAKDNLLRAIWHNQPDYVPWWSEGVCRLRDYDGRRPPKMGSDEWGVTWAPFDRTLFHCDDLCGSYVVSHPAASAAELLAMPPPDCPAPARFAHLMDGLDSTRSLRIGRHPLGPLDRLGALLGT